jgi:hypothetical protein
MTGLWVSILALRGKTIEEKKPIIEQAIQESHFKVVLIDGIRDLLSNINDPDQCTELVTWIEHLTITYNLHIVNVLHLIKPGSRYFFNRAIMAIHGHFNNLL